MTVEVIREVKTFTEVRSRLIEGDKITPLRPTTEPIDTQVNNWVHDTGNVVVDLYTSITYTQQDKIHSTTIKYIVSYTPGDKWLELEQYLRGGNKGAPKNPVNLGHVGPRPIPMTEQQVREKLAEQKAKSAEGGEEWQEIGEAEQAEKDKDQMEMQLKKSKESRKVLSLPPQKVEEVTPPVQPPKNKEEILASLPANG